MVVAIVLPSLGISILMVVANFLNLSIGLTGLMLVLFFISVMQLMFISLFRIIRPKVIL